MAETTFTLPAATMGEADLTLTLIPDGTDPDIAGKPCYRFTVTDGTYTLSESGLCGWGDAAEMARTASSFLAYYAECHGTAGNLTTVDGDPLPEYGPDGWAFLIAHSDTLSLAAVDTGEWAELRD